MPARPRKFPIHCSLETPLTHCRWTATAPLTASRPWASRRCTFSKKSASTPRRGRAAPQGNGARARSSATDATNIYGRQGVGGFIASGLGKGYLVNKAMCREQRHRRRALYRQNLRSVVYSTSASPLPAHDQRLVPRRVPPHRLDQLDEREVLLPRHPASELLQHVLHADALRRDRGPNFVRGGERPRARRRRSPRPRNRVCGADVARPCGGGRDAAEADLGPRALGA